MPQVTDVDFELTVHRQSKNRGISMMQVAVRASALARMTSCDELKNNPGVYIYIDIRYIYIIHIYMYRILYSLKFHDLSDSSFLGII